MSSGDAHNSLEKPPLEKPLQGQRVCVTGTLTAMSHADFAVLVEACGGQFVSQPVKDGFLLVVGPDGWPARDGSVSACFQRAQDLHASGSPVEFLSEEDFFSRIGLIESQGSLGGRCTISELARIAGVSAASLRRWTRLGLIQPVETIHQFA